MIYRMLKPLIFRIDPERAHDLTSALLARGARVPGSLAALAALFAFHDPILATECVGIGFLNPLGMAAGFDKRAELIAPLSALGFGHVEIGTVTPRPQPGNPKPRMFRLPEDAALINRLGFNSPGMDAVAERLRRPRPPGAVVGVNIGKNRDTPLEQAAADYLAAFDTLAPFGDYVTINISSPNTPGLRKLHDRAALAELIVGLAQANRRLARPLPLLLKLSPDESAEQIEESIDVGLACGCSGFIATNTTLARDELRSAAAGETGGLSGRPLAARAREVASTVARLVGQRAAVVAVGGIWDAADVYARLRAGAGLVQLYTALVYEGPGLAGRIARDLAGMLRRDGFRSIAEAVGVDRR